MNYLTPEECGISSSHVLAFYKELEYYGLSTNAVLMSRGNNIFSECYWKPFHKDFQHRMYSVSKSFVSLAIGFCEQDGLLTLDDPLVKFFPEYSHLPYQHNSTIREMLTMTTTIESSKSWFRSGTTDRTAYYFEQPDQKNPDTLFRYDSMGSYVLGVVVEKLTGKTLLDYLQDKALRDIGFSQNAYFLQCPGGHSWGDSGLMCTARDLWLFARFVLNKGIWNGKQYLNPEYINEATRSHVSNDPYGFFNHHNIHGYGYQFWCAPDGCFAAKGMGLQLAFCDPTHDFILIINSNNQGNDLKYEPVYRALYAHILPNLGKTLDADNEALSSLQTHINSRELYFLPGTSNSAFAEHICGKQFICSENPQDIKWFRLFFWDDTVTFEYENKQGLKTMTAGFGRNVFAPFPEDGYSDLVGTVSAPGHKYNAAFSADWPNERTLRIRVQIIDKYFGNLSILIAFRDENTVTIKMQKAAEAFLNEYEGIINATAQ